MPRKPVSGALQPAEAQWRQRAKLIEEYATLDQEMRNFKARELRHRKLRELILSWYPGVPAEEEALASGINFDIVVSARDRMRSVTAEGKQKLFKLWGTKEFLAKSVITLKSLPDPEDALGLYTVQSNTGPRHLRVVAKAQATADNAA